MFGDDQTYSDAACIYRGSSWQSHDAIARSAEQVRVDTQREQVGR